MTLDEVAARLYALPPEEFTTARNVAVAAARQAGDRELARAIGTLRRPTVGAWLVNLLSHQRPDLIGELFSLGAALRTAQRNLRGDELRELSVQRRTMIVALAREARALAIAAGRAVRDVLPLAEVETTLGAALADDEVAEQVRLGRLVKTTEYAGFGEAPRPQLRLVQGGAGAAVAAGAPPSVSDAEAPASKRSPAPASKRPGSAGPASVPGSTAASAAADVTDDLADDLADDGADDEAEAEAAAAEAEAAAAAAAAEAAARAARQAAARAAAADRRRRQQAAHRELLAARTALAEAEAARATAERAVLQARRRVEAALATTEVIAAEVAEAERGTNS